MKQFHLDEMFKKIANKNVCSVASSTVDVTPSASEIQDEIINYKTDSNHNSSQLPD